MPLKQATGHFFESAGADTSVSEGTNITASGSTNTKGSYTQLLASTAHPAGGVLIVLGGCGVSDGRFLIDIAIGAGGSEQVIIPNIFYHSQDNKTYMYFYMPIGIPKGSRIAARCQCSSASQQVRVNVIPVSGECAQNAAVAYGTDAANSRGTQMTGNASANTKGSWVQMTSATSTSHRWCVAMLRGNSGSQYLLDIGVGAAASEQVVVTNLNTRDSSGGEGVIYSFPLMIPKGTRVAARAAAAGGASTITLQLIMI